MLVSQASVNIGLQNTAITDAGLASTAATITGLLALVIGRLDYCNSLLYGLPVCYINKLQRVQNAAARLISNTTLFDHISPVMKDLHWLPVKYRIMFKLVVYI